MTLSPDRAATAIAARTEKARGTGSRRVAPGPGRASGSGGVGEAPWGR